MIPISSSFIRSRILIVLLLLCPSGKQHLQYGVCADHLRPSHDRLYQIFGNILYIVKIYACIISHPLKGRTQYLCLCISCAGSEASAAAVYILCACLMSFLEIIDSTDAKKKQYSEF